MKARIAIKDDFDYKVIDVIMVVEDEFGETDCYIRGFDENEWAAAETYAKQLAALLNLEVEVE